MFAGENISAWDGRLCIWRDPVFTGEGNKQQSHFCFYFKNFSSFWLWAVLNFPHSAMLSA